MQRSMLVAGVIAALLGQGCLEFGEGDAKVPGEPLGTYAVTASLETSDCGPGAVGSTDVWEFQIKLSRDTNYIYWLNGREAINGTIAGDGVSFAIDTRTETPLIEPEPGYDGCTLIRLDRASGSLENEGPDVERFQGFLRYGYLASEGSDCTPAIGVEGGFSQLPCEMTYEMVGRRTEAPPDLEEAEAQPK